MIRRRTLGSSILSILKILVSQEPDDQTDIDNQAPGKTDGPPSALPGALLFAVPGDAGVAPGCLESARPGKNVQ